MSAPLDLLPACDIDVGTFKYVLLKATAGNDDATYVVAGYADCSFHDDIVQRVRARVAGTDAGRGVALACVGGGRIQHDPAARRVLIYGFSQAYGRADHSRAAEIVRRAFPVYAATDVVWSNDGY